MGSPDGFDEPSEFPDIQGLAGTYVQEADPYLELSLYPDGAFRLELASRSQDVGYGCMDELLAYAEGTWRLDGGRLLFSTTSTMDYVQESDPPAFPALQAGTLATVRGRVVIDLNGTVLTKAD